MSLTSPYDFNEILSFKYHVSESVLNQVISLQFRVVEVKLLVQIFTTDKSEFHMLIKHCYQMGKNTVQTNQWLDDRYLHSAPLETVKRWYVNFKCSHTDTNDAEHPGC